MSGDASEVRRAVRRHLVDYAIDGPILVACSGGADSLTLALAAHVEADGLAGAVIVDHGLRPESSKVASVTADYLVAVGLSEVSVTRVNVTAEGSGPEAAARTARYAALRIAREQVGGCPVLLGHTLDDQAETVLLGLARGSGPRSLAGMRTVHDGWHRPLLGLRRHVVRSALSELAAHVDHPLPQGFPYDDPDNEDPAFTRSRVRHNTIETLEADLGPGVVEALARTAELSRIDIDALDDWADRTSIAIVDRGDDGAVSVNVDALAQLPPAIRTRVLRSAALLAGVPAGALTFDHTDTLDRFVVAWRGQGPAALPGRVTAYRRGAQLRWDSSGESPRTT
jgi:tRNA(Ile)-lysidine synthase